MYRPQRPLFGDGPNFVLRSHLYPRDDGYVDLITEINPVQSVDTLERTVYARLTLAEAVDVLHAQASLLMVEESPS